MEKYSLTKADRALAADFASNKGRLPIPVSGPYLITSHFGQYNVAGLKNVKLDNKGITLQAKPGAKARSVFNGVVTAIFPNNGLFNVIVRHGEYMTLYANLKKVYVKSGQQVTTKQELGDIFSDPSDGNRTTLEFRLYKGNQKLNPEPWLNR